MVEALGMSLTEFIFYLINFLILVGCLTKFLYKPFLNVLETRKQSIQDALDNAELTNKRADEKMENYNRQIAKLEEQGREIIKEAKVRADSQAAAIVDEANAKAGQIIAAAEKQIELERQKALEDMKQQVAALALLAAEKIIERNIAQIGQEKIVDEIIEQAGSRQWQS
ncbi:F0F1 ATP synthase subunit B [bacterium 210820-DFI.6.37]|nr:F0F1 ATP synthase subunit B [bacterium 210820-DFI.6.37]